MKEDLKKKAEELEQTLKMQFQMAKNDTGEIAKVGGTVLVGGLLSYTLIRLFRKKKNRKTDKVMQALASQGLLDDEIRAKLTQKRSSGLFGRLGGILLPMAINFGKERFFQRMEQGKRNKISEAPKH